jgi:hypothetical protein
MDDCHLGYTKKTQTFDVKCLPEDLKNFRPPAHRLLHLEISQRRKSQIARKGFCDPRKNPSRNCSKVLHFRASSPSSH